MKTKIVAVTNQKGGSGKTTVSMQLAGAMARQNQKVLVVDADPQGSASRWSASAPEEKVFPADVIGLGTVGGKIHQEVKKFNGKYDWIFIDCPPAIDSAAPQSALLIADLAIVPIIPSPPDLWAGVGIKELINRASVINDTLQARLIPNMCQPNINLAKDALDILKDFEIPLANTRLNLRNAYRKSAIFGGTVFDLGGEAKLAIKEVEALAKEIRSIIEGKHISVPNLEPATIGEV